MNDSLIIELLFEELPHDTLHAMHENFPKQLAERLADAGFIPQASSPIIRCYSTPRRIAVYIDQVASMTPVMMKTVKLMPVKYATDSDGKWTAAFLKKLKKLNLTETDVIKNGDMLLANESVQSQHLSDVLSDHLLALLLTLPVKNHMYWGIHSGPFIRPLRRLLIMHGDQSLPCTLWGIHSSATLSGHRTLTQGPIPLTHADLYESTLEQDGFVIPCPDKRRQVIEKALSSALDAIDHSEAVLEINEALLDEVTGLVEHPCVLQGSFPASYLALPDECLTLVLQKTQRYFPLRTLEGRLLNTFLFVANIDQDREGFIRLGAEKVINARLSDALFFFTQDQSLPLKKRTAALECVHYHAKLGSLYDVQNRITKIAQLLANIWGFTPAEKKQLHDACALLKADLVTDMVKEFPELQGIIGRCYAAKEGYDPIICAAIEEHYYPLNKDTPLPTHRISRCLAIAHKTEHLISFFSANIIPSGDKDPFGVRRAGIAFIRLISEYNLSMPLPDFLYTSTSVIDAPLQQSTLNALHEFLRDRCFFYLRETGHHDAQTIHAILKASFDYPHLSRTQIRLLEQYKKTDQFAQTMVTYKRLRNLLKKDSHISATIDIKEFCTPQENELLSALNTLHRIPEEAMEAQTCVYTAALEGVMKLLPVLNTFLDQVIIHVDNPVIKNNRMALLSCAKTLMTRFVDWEAFVTLS